MTSAVWFLIGTLGLGGALLAVGIFFLGWPFFVNTKIGRLALAIGGGVLGLLAVFAKGSAQGAAEARKNQEKVDEDYVAKRKADDDRIDALPDSELDRLLVDGTIKPSGPVDAPRAVLQPVSTLRPNESPKAGGG